MNATGEQKFTLTKADLARHLQVSVRTVERMRKAGTLPPTVPGLSRPRWAWAAVTEWLRVTGARS